MSQNNHRFDSEVFGRRLKQVREALGLSHNAFGHLTGTSGPQAKCYEAGVAAAEFVTVTRVATKLGIPPRALIDADADFEPYVPKESYHQYASRVAEMIRTLGRAYTEICADAKVDVWVGKRLTEGRFTTSNVDLVSLKAIESHLAGLSAAVVESRHFTPEEVAALKNLAAMYLANKEAPL